MKNMFNILKKPLVTEKSNLMKAGQEKKVGKVSRKEAGSQKSHCYLERG